MIFLRSFFESNEPFTSRLDVKYIGHDGFGVRLDLIEKSSGKKIGEVVFRRKSYLQSFGYDIVHELHIGFKEDKQRKGFFADAIYELLNNGIVPLYLAYGRIINDDILKAVNKLDKRFFDIVEIEDRGIIIDFGPGF